MNYSTSIYYTFSTIAQVLAGFIALGGVFVLFKLQDTKKMQFVQINYFFSILDKLKLRYSHFYECPSIAINLNILLKAETTSGMLNELNNILSNIEVTEKQETNKEEFRLLTEYRNIFRGIEGIKNSLKRYTVISVVLSVATITASLFVLGCTHLFKAAAAEFLSPFIIVSGIISTIFSMRPMIFAILISILDISIQYSPFLGQL